MTLVPLTIPGVSGAVTAVHHFWKGWTFTVDDVPVTRHGFPRKYLALPGDTGPVEVEVKANMVQAFPILVLDGVEYRTGPETPRSQQVVALLPLVLLLLVQGALGFLVALASLTVNMGLIRSARSDKEKTGLMVAVFVGALMIDIALLLSVISLTA